MPTAFTCDEDYHPVHTTRQECAERSYAEQPCAECSIRRDEHADQAVQSSIPALDITDHAFKETPC